MLSNKFLTGTFVGSLLILVAAFAIATPKAEAGIYPSPGSSASQKLISSFSGNWGPKYIDNNPDKGIDHWGQYNCNGSNRQQGGHCTTGLNAETTRYKIFADDPTPGTDNDKPTGTSVTIKDGCKDSPVNDNNNYPDHPDKGSGHIQVFIRPTQNDGGGNGSNWASKSNYSSGDCSGNDLVVGVPSGAFNKSQSDRFGDGVYTALVVIEKRGGSDGTNGTSAPGNKLFTLVYGGGDVFYDDAQGGSNRPYFAVASVNANRDDEAPDYVFRFTVDCKYTGGKVSIAWGDLDITNPDENEDGIASVTLSGPGGSVAAKDLGGSGNNSFDDKDIRNLQVRATYTLRFKGLQNSNGFRVYLPFSPREIPGECDIPPQPNPPNCEKYEDVLHRNSRYKFRLFNIDHGASSGSYLTAPAVISNDRVFSPSFNPGGSPGPASGYVANLPDGVNPNSGDEIYGPENFPPPTGRDWVVVVERSEHFDSNGDGVITSSDDYRWTSSVQNRPQGLNCYSATCSIGFDETVPPGVANGVQAGQPFKLVVTLTNTGKARLPWTMQSGGGLAVTRTGTLAGSSYTRSAVDQNRTFRNFADADITITAPADIGSYPLVAYPHYNNGDPNHFKLGPNCTGPNVETYQHFNIDPFANALGANAENPTVIPYTTGGTKTEGPDVTATANTHLTKQPFGGAVQTVQTQPPVSHSYGTHSDNYSYNPPTITVGDEYCSHVSIFPASGWAGPAGKIADGKTATASSPCMKVNNAPYIHILNSDASAGGGFGSNCSTNSGGIKTFFNNNAGNITGSGVQIGALSINPIYGFSSALLRNTAPNPPTGLSFSNNKHLTGGGYNAGVGGGLKGTHCVKDYFSTKPAAAVADSSTSVSASSLSGVKYYTPGGGTGTLDINAGTIAAGTNTAVFVRGNVRITGDIKYANSANWGTIEDVPSFKLIVYGGKITINNNVSQLDGLYVSQPNGSTGGRIDTCEVTDLDSLLTACDNQLVVNGGFVGKQIYLLRSFGSLRDTVNTPGERLNASTKSCSVLGTGGKRNTGNGDCSSEIFNFSPEMYLNQSDGTTPDSGPTTGGFDYITSLAPVL